MSVRSAGHDMDTGEGRRPHGDRGQVAMERAPTSREAPAAITWPRSPSTITICPSASDVVAVAVTGMSPLRSRPNSAGSRITRTGPVTRPPPESHVEHLPLVVEDPGVGQPAAHLQHRAPDDRHDASGLEVRVFA